MAQGISSNNGIREKRRTATRQGLTWRPDHPQTRRRACEKATVAAGQHLEVRISEARQARRQLPAYLKGQLQKNGRSLALPRKSYAPGGGPFLGKRSVLEASKKKAHGGGRETSNENPTFHDERGAEQAKSPKTGKQMLQIPGKQEILTHQGRASKQREKENMRSMHNRLPLGTLE